MADPAKGHEFLVRLKEQGDKRHRSFDTLFDFLDRKAREKGIPLNGQFELTPLCNFDCRMCYTHLTKEQKDLLRRFEEVTAETATPKRKSFFEKLKDNFK